MPPEDDPRDDAPIDRQEYEAWEAQRKAIIDRDLRNALDTRALTEGAKGHLIEKWRSEFDLRERDGAFEARDHHGWNASEFVEDAFKFFKGYRDMLVQPREDGRKEGNAVAIAEPPDTLLADLKKMYDYMQHYDYADDVELCTVNEAIERIESLEAESEEVNRTIQDHQTTPDYEMGQINADRALTAELGRLRTEVSGLKDRIATLVRERDHVANTGNSD